MTSPEHVNSTYSILVGVNAGIDMVSSYCAPKVNYGQKLSHVSPFYHTYLIDGELQMMIPYNYTEFIDGLTYLVNNSFISMSRIDDAVRRILRVKFMMGLFEYPFPDYSMIKYLGSQVS